MGQAGLAQIKWTDLILDEVFGAIAKHRPDIPQDKLQILRSRMSQAVPDSRVQGFEPLIEGLSLPDVDDRHVLAAAIHCKAHYIVTNNRRDFPAKTLGKWDIERISPDEFILDQLERSGLVESVSALRTS